MKSNFRIFNDILKNIVNLFLLINNLALAVARARFYNSYSDIKY